MRINTTIITKAWHKHPVVCSVLYLLALGYVIFVAYFTSVNGIEQLGNALLIPVPVVVFFFCMSAFPFWAIHHEAAAWSVFICELIFVVVWAVVCARRHYRPRVLVGALLAVAAINLTLNFVFPNWAD